MRDDNPLVHPQLDRVSHKRHDETWLAEQWQHADARIILLQNNEILVRDDAARRLPVERIDRDALSESPIFLGIENRQPVFAVVANAYAPESQERFIDLRSAAGILPASDAGLFAQSQALFNWHTSHRFCGQCGQATEFSAGGYERMCRNEHCTVRAIFPRVDPAIIVAVSRQDKLLLGRQAGWPAGRFSCVAGFVEPGESLEQAVRREVHEETGITVGEVHYHSSQPWPFPQSIMLGFFADAVSEDIRLLDNELEDARWFDREELLADNNTLSPSRLSISWRLIRDWLHPGS